MSRNNLFISKLFSKAKEYEKLSLSRQYCAALTPFSYDI